MGRPGPTYTFAFWGISQLFDALKWEIKITGPGIDFNRFCGCPPVHLVLYTLQDEAANRNERRHLESRKSYLMRFAFWSSMGPPSDRHIRQLIPSFDECSDVLRRHSTMENNERPWKMDGLFSC